MGKISNLYLFGVSLGFKSIFYLKKFTLRIGEIILTPMNYWRVIETKLVLNSLNPEKGERILDLGSPKLLSLYLTKNVGSNLIVSDINDYFKKYCSDFAKTLNLGDNYRLVVLDARKIDLPSNSVDKIYSISVFEHIPDNGDLKAMREVQKILKKGGIFTLTLPYGKEYTTEYRDPKKFYYSNNVKEYKKGDNVFYQRDYDEKSLNERIVNSSELKLIEKQYIGQRIKLPSNRFMSLLGPINIILSYLNHIGPNKDPNKLKNVSMVHLTFQK